VSDLLDRAASSFRISDGAWKRKSADRGLVRQARWRLRTPIAEPKPKSAPLAAALGHAELPRPNLLCRTQSEKRHSCAARLDDDHPLAPA
jgi:hypothetical protein